MSGFAATGELVRAAAFGCVLVFVFGAWSILRRGPRKALRLGLYAVATLMVFGLLARPRVAPPQDDEFAILLTVGSDRVPAGERLRALRAGRPEAEIRLAPGAANVPGPEAATTRWQLGRWAELATVNTSWRLVGSGLLPAEVLALPPGLRWTAEPPPAPSGVVELHWPRSVPLGREVVVSGRIRRAGDAAPPIGERLRLRGPGGIESEAELDASGGFRLTALPRAVGRLELLLEASSASSARVEARLDLTVAPGEFPRVRILAARPNPEAAALRRWLARRGAAVELRVGLSAGVEAEISTEAARVEAGASPDSPPVVVVFGELPRPAFAALRQSPLILVGDRALRAWRAGAASESAGESAEEAASSVEPHSASGERLGALSLAAGRLPKEEILEPLWLDEEGAVLAGVLAVPASAQRVVATWIESSFRYSLRGEGNSFGMLWSVLLEAAAPVERNPRCSVADGPIVDGDPLTVFCWRGAAIEEALDVALETPDGVSHDLELTAHPFDGDRFETRIWPRGEGWHRLRVRQAGRHSELEFRARSRDQWAAWDDERRRLATDDLVTDSKAPPSPTVGVRHPLPGIGLFALLLLLLGTLWGVERSSS